MAYLTAQARLKLDGLIFLGSEPNKGPFPSNLRSHHRRPKRTFNSSRICSSTSSSCSANKGASFRSETRWNIGDESVYGDSEDFEDDSEDDDDDGNDDLSCFRGLVLDIAYRPINVVCWKRAICLEYMEKADVLEYYDQTVNSPSGDFCIPAVLRVRHLLQLVKRRRIKSNLSRKNLLLRDSYTCQYCCSPDNLTIDHVVPVARGGQWTWENLVTACAKCNAVKGHKTLEETNMKLLKVPKAPKEYDILAIPLTTSAINMLKMRGTPQEWRQYLP